MVVVQVQSAECFLLFGNRRRNLYTQTILAIHPVRKGMGFCIIYFVFICPQSMINTIWEIHNNLLQIITEEVFYKRFSQRYLV